ncbi:hypothetical protein EKG37_10640 [Robertmurraya yapensis]|uniref:Uncharacterized protein n=2 Tax=Bacillaceae TaxID=186817 RepID=A0A431W9E4_9BACI|nr:hypothetical protein [Bacillus yapensis]RTR31947.1 hypothetical protein EKG37_10640 [Bacillus yapensis]TKS95961.1 hypothetical protein FAR12_10640 [Bacillus yapensis]
MKNTKKKLLIGFSTILVVAALGFGLLQIVTNNGSEVASTHQTNATEKTDAKKDGVKKYDKVEAKKEEPKEEGVEEKGVNLMMPKKKQKLLLQNKKQNLKLLQLRLLSL